MPDTPSPSGPELASVALGDRVRGPYRLKQVLLRRNAQGKSFLLGQLQDASGCLGFVWWHPGDQSHDGLAGSAFVEVDAKVERHKERLQLVVQDARPHDGAGLDPRAYLPRGTIDPELLTARLVELIAGVTDPAIQALLRAIFIEDAAFAARFRVAPAAVSLHHAHISGLLAHSVSVAELALLMADRYPLLDRDLLLAGALLHDCCKCLEMAWEDGPFRYTTAGNLVGHIVMGSQLLAERAAAIPDFPPRRLMELQHLVLSHHGEVAHGAAREPMLIEAIVLHLIDNIDSRVAGFEEALKQPGGLDPEWTEFLKIFDRRMYRGGR